MCKGKITTVLLSLLVCLVLIASASAEEAQKITIMVDGTVLSQNQGRDVIEAKWEELHPGYDLEIIQPDHIAYYDALNQRMENREDWPDVVILNPTTMLEYADKGYLWDMTDAWDNSKTENSNRFYGDKVIDGLKLEGKLYGFSPARGNGCITYVKKAWMDACGITEVPTTYDAYINMLNAFKDKYGTFAVSAPGFIGTDAPYINYLPEFYQDADYSFVQNENGVWMDGFTQDSMKAALQRLQDAVAAGLIDKETLTNRTADVRNKFYDDKFGVFTYWAGAWAANLKNNLEANGKDGELVAVKPLEGLPLYYDRIPQVWAITTACENPQEVFNVFIDTMLDGGDTQMLWTYGVEGFHWSKEGGFHMLEHTEKPGSAFTKNHIDPMLALADFAEGYYDPKTETVKPEAQKSMEVFISNSRMAGIIPNTPEMIKYGNDLNTLKTEIIAEIVLGHISIEEGYERFVNEGGLEASNTILESFGNNAIALIREFVERNYVKILGRPSDEAGKNDWVNQLRSGKLSGGGLMHGFVNSDEFRNSGKSNDEQVEIMYEVMLDRSSDPSGKSFWLDRLNKGMSINAIVAGFVGSQEFIGVCNDYGINNGTYDLTEERDQNFGVTGFVNRCYDKALSRNPDTDGLNYWCGQLLGKNQTAQQVAHGFIESEEMKNKGQSNEEYVRTMYELFLDREPDADGFRYWTEKLAAGESRETIENGFAQSVEFREIVAGYGVE